MMNRGPSGSGRWNGDSYRRGHRPSETHQPSSASWPGSNGQTVQASTDLHYQQTYHLPSIPAAPPNVEDEDPPFPENDDDLIPEPLPTTTTTTTTTTADLTGDETATLASYPYSIYNHGTWTPGDDRTLIAARARGQNWAELQRTHFPSKTANACRKRYERLVERRGIYDYSARRLEGVASEYMAMRRDIWSGLAERVGMKWEVVEALVCTWLIPGGDDGFADRGSVVRFSACRLG